MLPTELNKPMQFYIAGIGLCIYLHSYVAEDKLEALKKAVTIAQKGKENAQTEVGS